MLRCRICVNHGHKSSSSSSRKVLAGHGNRIAGQEQAKHHARRSVAGNETRRFVGCGRHGQHWVILTQWYHDAGTAHGISGLV